MRFLCGHPGHTADVDLTEMVLAELRSATVEFVTITPQAIGERLRALRRDQQTRRDVLSALTGKDPVPDLFRVVIVPAEDDPQPYGMYSAEDLRRVRNREQLARAPRRRCDKPTGPPLAEVAYLIAPPGQSLQIFPGVEAVPECTQDIVLIPERSDVEFGVYYAEQLADHLLHSLTTSSPEAVIADTLRCLPQAPLPGVVVPCPPPRRGPGARFVLVGLSLLLAVTAVLLRLVWTSNWWLALPGFVLLLVIAAFVPPVCRWVSRLLGQEPARDCTWRVVIECPIPAGSPVAPHSCVFTGADDELVGDMRGPLASSVDLSLENAVKEDLTPRQSLDRLEKHIGRVVGAQALFTAVLAGFGWLSGGIGALVREEPVAFVIAIVLATLPLLGRT